MRTEFYATTKDLDGHSHHFTVSANDPAPNGHEIVQLRPAHQFPATAVLSPSAIELLNSFKN